MFSLSQCIYEEGIEQGIAAFVKSDLEEKNPKERTIQKIQKFFALTEEKAEEYYERIADEAEQKTEMLDDV